MFNSDKKKRGHAIALFSGGLDSCLAVLLVMKQGIEVTALTFMTHFGCDISDKSSCGSNPYPVAEKFGFNVKLMHLGEKFINIVKNPRYGYGKNMNPCIDCRLLMLEEAKNLMEMVNADFVITGEVLGQRPKSQRREAMLLVDRKCGLDGRLVRPLSAKFLPETIPEKTGLLDRNLLLDISGRSRKRQIELAREFNLTEYPPPAGGCLLTEPGYAKRLKDFFTHNDNFESSDLLLLRHGRHFRIDGNTKIIVGRNKNDNDKIREYSNSHHIKLEAMDTGSPITLLVGDFNDEKIALAASITARYSDLKYESQVEITYSLNDADHKIRVRPAEHDELVKYMIK